MIVDRRPNRIVYEPGAPCGEYLAFWLMEELLASAAVPSGLGCDTFLLVGGRGIVYGSPNFPRRPGISLPRKATRRTGTGSGPPDGSGVGEVTLGRVAFRCRVSLFPAVHHYRVHQRHDPDHHD